MPLRFPRPAAPVIAAGMTAVWVVAASAPALADQTRHQEWWLDSMGVTQAWQASRGAGVTVAVLSDGVDAAQPDISRSVTVGPDLTNSNETASTYVGVRGTAIASLIAGRGHGPRGRSGIIGVAPRARVLSVRVSLDAKDPAMDSATVGGGLPDAIAAGIRYAVAHHATVIDLPVDPGQPSPATIASLPIPANQTTAPQMTGINAAAGGSTAERAAIAFAVRKKVVLVAPAGDNAAGTDAANYPAAYPGVISVGAFDSKFAKSSFSSNQPYVTVTAAGQGVMAADNHGGYAVVNSTSAASAVVTGIAALIRSRFPSLSPAQVTRVLTSTTLFQRPGGRRHGSGFGTVDAQRAIAAAAALSAPASQRAGAGAQPWASPPSPGAPTVTSQALVPRVLRAGILSAAVLVVLLIVVLGYAAVRRRRKPDKPAPMADWAPAAQPAYAPYGSADNDRMLEFFAAPANSGASPAAGATAAAGAGGAAGGSGVGAWVPLGSRGHGRQPQVSGRPPWDPARKPDSELPWAAPGPGRPQARPAVMPPPSAAAARPAPAPPPLAAAARPAPAPPPATPAPPPADAAPAGEAAARASWPGAPAASAAPADQSQPAANGQAWQELTDRSLAAIRAVSETTTQPRPATAKEARPAQAEAPAPAAPPPASSPPAGAAPASSAWTSPPRPQSPSGAPWEPAGNPDPESSPDAADLHWLPASTMPADTEQESAQPASGLPRRKPAKSGDTTRRSTGTHRKAARPAVAKPAVAKPPVTRPAAAASSGAHAAPARPAPASEPAPADSHPPATGEAESHWPIPATASAPPWEQDTGDSSWPAAPAQPAADALWQSPAAQSGWDPAAAEASWERPGGDPSADTGQFSWRSSAQTDTFPAIGDDDQRDDA